MQERDKAKYRHKGYKDDHVRCVYGDVPYERVVYETYSEDGKREFVFCWMKLCAWILWERCL